MTPEQYNRATGIQKSINNKQYFFEKLNDIDVLLMDNQYCVNDDYANVMDKTIFDKEIGIFKNRIRHILHEQIAVLEKEFEGL